MYVHYNAARLLHPSYKFILQNAVHEIVLRSVIK